MKRIRVDLQQIANYQNLHLALYKAARGKRQRPVVQAFLTHTEQQLNCLSQDIRSGCLPYGRYNTFTICDPKPRLIHAACFEDRVFHHALINQIGPTLEKAMHSSSYACLPGKGIHRAVTVVQKGLQRWSWYGQVDIAGYFSCIDHELMLQVLMRRFKGEPITSQFIRILQSPPFDKGTGLPIGALTSQYFANYFLDGLDRLLAADPRVTQHLRYMDDIVWWGRSKSDIRSVLTDIEHWIQQHKLTLKPAVTIQRSHQGITFCGHLITPGSVRLTTRKKQRYQQRRLHWEQAWQQGDITDTELQRHFNGVNAVITHCDSSAWRRQNLRYFAPPDV